MWDCTYGYDHLPPGKILPIINAGVGEKRSKDSCIVWDWLACPISDDPVAEFRDKGIQVLYHALVVKGIDTPEKLTEWYKFVDGPDNIQSIPQYKYVVHPPTHTPIHLADPPLHLPN